jgi:hypothetical protein
VKDPLADTRTRKALRRGLLFKLAALAVIGSALGGMGLARWLQQPSADPAPADEGPLKMPDRLFRGWTRPDLVLVLSAQQHGYLGPCGCSRPQVGGLERRYNLLKVLKGRGWPVVAADLGDIPQKRGPSHLPNVQGLIKYRYAMKSLKAMDYAAVGLGEYEASLNLFNVLGEYALNNPKPRVLAANLKDYKALEVYSGEVVQPRGSPVKVGLTSVVGPSVAEQIKDPNVVFTSSAEALRDALRKMETRKVDLPVLLYQGRISSNHRRAPYTEAMACAEAFPEFPVILALSDEDEPPGAPLEVKHPGTDKATWIVTVGHKGKYVGVVGVWKTGKADRPLEFRYQLVELTEAFLTPKEWEKGHPIIELMEDYTQELKRENYLTRIEPGQHLLQAMAPVKGVRGPATPTYVGSERCKTCHKSAFKVWAKSAHSKAYQTLVDAKRPSLRQYDTECIVCHTTGFGYHGGFTSADRTPKLKNVGCESCHGPGSVHAANQFNVEWQRRMNPWHAPPKETEAQKKKREARIDRFCQSCHDIDNDVHWTHQGLKKKWPFIEH